MFDVTFMEVFKMKKALLIGNGFTSQIIPSYKSVALMEEVWSLIPKEMSKIESLFNPFRINPTKGNPYNCIAGPEYGDEEDCFIGHVPTYMEEEFSSDLRDKICRVLAEKYKIKKPSKICQNLFIDAGLCFEMSRNKIVGIESPLKVLQIGLKSGSITKEEAKRVEEAIKKVLFNNGNYHLPTPKDCEPIGINRVKAQKYFAGFSTIFTTNYDLILDDLVHDKVKHLHGGFCFPSAYEKDYKHRDSNLYEIVVAADGKAKDRQIHRTRETLFSKYLDSLATEDFDELHIVGYSGENDIHINNAIRNNERIKRVYVYVAPSDANKEEKRYHYGRQYRPNPNEIISLHNPYGLSLISWCEFWTQIT